MIMSHIGLDDEALLNKPVKDINTLLRNSPLVNHFKFFDVYNACEGLFMFLFLQQPQNQTKHWGPVTGLIFLTTDWHSFLTLTDI